MVLTVSPPKWPPKDKHCSLLAEFTAHWVSFPTLNAKLFIQELWKQDKDWHEAFSQSHPTRMEHDIWEPNSVVLSAVTQIYWRRWKQTVLLHRCLCQSLFGSSIPLFYSNWKSDCQPGISQRTSRTSQTTQHSKVGAARCSYWKEMLKLCNSATPVVHGR